MEWKKIPSERAPERGGEQDGNGNEYSREAGDTSRSGGRRRAYAMNSREGAESEAPQRRRRRISEMGGAPSGRDGGRSGNQPNRYESRNYDNRGGYESASDYGREGYDRERSYRNREDAPNYREQYNQARNNHRQRYQSQNSGGEAPVREQRYDRRGDYSGGRSYSSQNRQQGGYQDRQQGGGRGSNQGGCPQRQGAGGGRTFDNKRKSGPQRPKMPPTYETDQLDPTEEIRLNKFLSNAGVCSRREADELIKVGGVVVNGKPVTELGTKITAMDRVEVNGRQVTPEKKVYLLLNKPRNCVTTTDDPQERLTVMNLVKTACKERIYPVGRLDRNTTGVLLLTNDGELASQLVHPSFKKKKIYHVWLDKEVAVEDMQQIANGVELEDGEMHADAISYADEEDRTQVGIEIHSGRNRIVRRLFEHLGYHVRKLDRVYFAGLTKKNLGRGKWRYLTEEEVRNLKMGAFE